MASQTRKRIIWLKILIEIDSNPFHTHFDVYPIPFCFPSIKSDIILFNRQMASREKKSLNINQFFFRYSNFFSLWIFFCSIKALKFSTVKLFWFLRWLGKKNGDQKLLIGIFRGFLISQQYLNIYLSSGFLRVKHAVRIKSIKCFFIVRFVRWIFTFKFMWIHHVWWKVSYSSIF